MPYFANSNGPVFAEPSRDAARLRTFPPGIQLHATGNTFDDDGHVHWVEIRLPSSLVTGWISTLDFTEKPGAPPPPIDMETFVRSCLTVERELNADPLIGTAYVSADFLIARAFLESNVSNDPAPGIPGTGPLALSDPEWASFRASGFVAAADFPFGQKRFQLAQIYAAGHAMHATVAAIASGLGAAAGTPADDPVQVSYLDLFIGYLAGPAAAVAVNGLDAAARAATPISALAGVDAAAIAARPLLAEVTPGTSVSGFVDLLERTLLVLLDKAFDLIKTLAADELPKPPTGGTPWLNTAQIELDLGVTETNANRHRITAYFDAIGMPGQNTPFPPWCGAFVGFCMKENDVRPLPPSPGLAVSWKTWGTRSIPLGADSVPVGSVVVLKPQAPGTTGHVGFFSRFVGTGQVELLGGNQGNAVSRTTFKVSDVAMIRMRDDGGAPPPPPPSGYDVTLAGLDASRQPMADLIVARFREAGFTAAHQQLTAVANAIRESGLDPTARNTNGEDSVGLFQCNRRGGHGTGHTVARLMEPDYNISVIIAVARRSKAFAAASTLEAAMKAFVEEVEIPADTNGEIGRRLEIARAIS